MRRSGASASLSVFTFGSACNTILAAAASNSGRAGDGIDHRSHSASDSVSLIALPNPWRNSDLVNETARVRLSGLASAGNADRNWATAAKGP